MKHVQGSECNYYYRDLEDRMARDRMVSIFLTSFLHILVKCPQRSPTVLRRPMPHAMLQSCEGT